MSRDEKKGFALLFFVIPKKTTNSLVDVRATKPYKSFIQWLAGGICVCIIFLLYYSDVSRSQHYFLPPLLNSSTVTPVSHNVTRTEVRHVGFLKVHKAASSTIENVLFRFGLARNLSFVLPVEGYKFTTYILTEIPKLIKPNNNDILAIHSVFDGQAYSSVLCSDAVYIAIVREPLSLFISGAFYHRDVWPIPYLQSVPKKNYIQNLIRFPELYDKDKISYTRNSMALDFGFPNDLHVTDTERIHDYLQTIDKQFLFVMIMEYLDESLIYLRRLLNWNLRDVLYIPLNGYKHQPVSVSKRDKRKFKDRNFLDVAIYEYFKDSFMRKIANASLNFIAEVKHFKIVRGSVETFCSDGVKRRLITIEGSEWNSQFSLTTEDCRYMTLSELEFVDHLRDIVNTKATPSGATNPL